MRIIQITEQKHKSIKDKLSKMRDELEDCLECLENNSETDYDRSRDRDYERDDDDKYYDEERIRRSDRRRSRY